MANISHFTQTVNGVSTTYDIHDAGAVPRDGGAVLSGEIYAKTTDDSALIICSGSGWGKGAALVLRGKDSATWTASAQLRADNGTDSATLTIFPNGNAWFAVNNTNRYFAFTDNTIPRSLGSVVSGNGLYRTAHNSYLELGGGTNRSDGATIAYNGATNSSNAGYLIFTPNNGSAYKVMYLSPDGTWTWNGSAVQITSDQRLKQQITEIDDKLLDAWEDVNLVQFKYNDAVDEKGDKARLHTGYVVQQIDNACKKHGVDISAYGLYCHEEYPEETEEVEVEQADGTKTKERKVIREASEHYSLRYTEALIVECKYLRRCIARLTARIEELEKGNITK